MDAFMEHFAKEIDENSFAITAAKCWNTRLNSTKTAKSSE